jgi:hypothetical protein
MIKTKTENPWVHLDTAEDLKEWTKQDNLQWNQNNRIMEKYRFYIKAFDFIVSTQLKGDYLEFGSHRVRTFRMALTEAKHQGIQNMRFLAFDSFKGLPPNDGTHGIGEWQAGGLTTSEDDFWKIIKEHGLYTDQVETFPGFYNESLTLDLKKQLSAVNTKASIICVDCDLYESAVPVFHFIEEFLQDGTVIYIDDWFASHKGNPNKGLPKAFHEFQQRSKYKFVDFLSVSWFGRSFIVYKD